MPALRSLFQRALVSATAVALGSFSPAQCDPAWSALPGNWPDGPVYGAAALPGGGVAIAGSFALAGTLPANNVAVWNGVTWQALGPGVSGTIADLVVRPNGNIIVGGDLIVAGQSAHCAEWAGASWQALGPPVGNGAIYELALMPNGDLIASGSFNQIGGVNANLLARWDGATWSDMTMPLPPFANLVDALLPLPTGELLVGHDRIWHWDGAIWTALSTEIGGVMRCMIRLQNGDLVVGGDLGTPPTQPGLILGHIARWSDGAWHAYGSGMSGSSIVGITSVYALHARSGVEVIAGGDFKFADGTPADLVARWDGQNWHAIDGGFGNGGFWEQVWDFAEMADGNLIAVGGFTTAGNPTIPVHRVAQLALPCEPTAVMSTPSCTSSAGECRLAADTLPAIDTTFRRTGTGLPDPALVFGITNLVPAAAPVPLSLYGPSPAGCEQLVDPVATELLSLGGVTAWNMMIPNDPGLIGLPLEQQLIAIEVSQSGALDQLTATNRLSAVVGSF